MLFRLTTIAIPQIDKTIMAMMDRFFNVKLVQEFATSIFELNIDEEIGTKVESPIISMNV